MSLLSVAISVKKSLEFVCWVSMCLLLDSALGTGRCEQMGPSGVQSSRVIWKQTFDSHHAHHFSGK